jgi:hypothetical protein
MRYRKVFLYSSMREILKGAKEGLMWSAIMSIASIIGYLLIINYTEFWMQWI